MEEALTAVLLGDAALTLSIGNRLHWGRAPQGAVRPFVILQVISADVDQTMQGRTGLEQVRLQVDAYSDRALEAKAISALVIRALEAARGTHGETMVHSVNVDSRRDLQPDGSEGKQPVFRRQTDLMIWHTTHS